MPVFAAFLGHNPPLSRSELASAFADISFGDLVAKQVQIFETSASLDQSSLDMLGGTVVLVKRISDVGATLGNIPHVLAVELAGVKGKATFSLRTAGLSPGEVRALYRDCKEHLKQKGISSRYIGSDRDPALSIQLIDEELLDGKKGVELVVLRDRKHFWIGRTIAAQDTKSYTKRDMEKPVRDTSVGLLPPKLAQVLINLGLSLVRSKEGQLPSSITVFDPFCGTGVIPMECMLRGFHMLASDVSPKAVTGCEKNIEWMRKVYDIKKDVSSHVWKQDATKAFALEKKPDVIITETTLGPALKKRPLPKEITAYKKEVEAIEAGFLKNASTALKGVPIVCMWPVWYGPKGPVFCDKLPDIAVKHGYKLVLPPETESMIPGRISLLYRRSDQFVGREIVLLKPKR